MNFAFFSSFQRQKKQVFTAELNPPRTLAGPLLALPHEVCISKEWDTAPATVWYLPHDCIPLQRTWCKVPSMALGGEKSRLLLAWHHLLLFLVPTNQTSSFHFLCPFFFVSKTIWLTYISFDAPHRQTPGAAAPLGFIQPELWHWMPFPAALWYFFWSHILGISISL